MRKVITVVILIVCALILLPTSSFAEVEEESEFNIIQISQDDQRINILEEYLIDNSIGFDVIKNPEEGLEINDSTVIPYEVKENELLALYTVEFNREDQIVDIVKKYKDHSTGDYIIIDFKNGEVIVQENNNNESECGCNAGNDSNLTSICPPGYHWENTRCEMSTDWVCVAICVNSFKRYSLCVAMCQVEECVGDCFPDIDPV